MAALHMRRYTKQYRCDYGFLIAMVCRKLGETRGDLAIRCDVSKESIYKYSNKPDVNPKTDCSRKLWNVAIDCLTDDEIERCVYHD